MPFGELLLRLAGGFFLLSLVPALVLRHSSDQELANLGTVLLLVGVTVAVPLAVVGAVKRFDRDALD